ncbi:MAG: hypothetical protein HDR51_06430 [Treponema sp.]|nr:hypothetical protein [Treponema sp.]
MKNILPVAVAKDTGRKIQCSFSFTLRLPVAGQNWLNTFTTHARAFRTHCGIDFFRATAATTIRAILPFSLRLLECFFIFSKFAVKKSNDLPLTLSQNTSSSKTFSHARNWKGGEAVPKRSEGMQAKAGTLESPVLPVRAKCARKKGKKIIYRSSLTQIFYCISLKTTHLYKQFQQIVLF